MLNRLVVQNIQEITSLVAGYEDKFIELVTEESQKNIKSQRISDEKEFVKAQKRIIELDGLFKRMYEDNYNGKLTDERFTKLSSEYEVEQQALRNRVDVLKESLKQRIISRKTQISSLVL